MDGTDHPTPQHDGASSVGEGTNVTNVNIKGPQESVFIGSKVVYKVNQLTHHTTYVINNCEGRHAPDKAEKVFRDQQMFLKRIEARFLTEVKPVESGLLEKLKKVDVINNDDADSATCHHETSRSQAAYLFGRLMQVPPWIFAERCMPILSSLYPNILEGTTFAYYLGENPCVRCFVMSRIAAARFADVLVSTRTCSGEEYSGITESTDPEETKWARIFQILNRVKNGLDCAGRRNGSSRKSGTKKMVELLSQGLKNGGQFVPDNFHALVSRGLHCKCYRTHDSSVGEQKRRRRRRRRCNSVTNWAKSHRSCNEDRNREEKQGADDDTSTLRDKQNRGSASKYSSSSEYPPSSSSGLEESEEGQSSASSSERCMCENSSSSSCECQMNQSTQSDENDVKSREERLSLVALLESLNTAILNAALVKPLWLEMEGILETVKILTLPDATSSLETTSSPEIADLGKVARLRGRAKELHSSLNARFKQASDVFALSEASQAQLKSLPLSKKKFVESKHFLCVNELNEASDFVRKSQMVMEKLENGMPSKFQLMSS